MSRNDFIRAALKTVAAPKLYTIAAKDIFGLNKVRNQPLHNQSFKSFKDLAEAKL